MRSRKRWIGASLLALLAACSPQPAAPNIVIFVADDLGWGDVGFHGSEIETPRLDQLAREGLELSAHYVQPICSPTRAALLTGRYPIRYGFQVGVVRPWSTSGLPLSEVLLPERLADAGYATHMVGKWHLGAASSELLPTERGFDSHYGQYTGLIDYWTHERLGGLDWHRDAKPLREEGYATHLLRDEAVRIVREHDYEAPLFLYVPFSAPHFPLQAPAQHIERYASTIKDPKRRVYAAMVSCMDEAIGATLDQLEQVGQRENTLVLFLSDNGAYLAQAGSNGDLRGQKSDLYEGAIRAPTLISWPGRIAPGKVLDSPLHVTDWFPTLLQIATHGQTRPTTEWEPKIDGVDLSAHLLDSSPLADRTILLNTQRKQGALRAGRWKLVAHHHLRTLADRENDATFGVELYDLEADPIEHTDRAADRPELRDRLLEELMTFHEERTEVPQDRGMEPENYVVPAIFGPKKPHD